MGIGTHKFPGLDEGVLTPKKPLVTPAKTVMRDEEQKPTRGNSLGTEQYRSGLEW